MKAMTVGEIASALNATVAEGDASAVVTSVVTDSRETKPGSVFFALRGGTHDGHDFIPDAIQRGATALVCARGAGPDRAETDSPAARLRVGDTGAALMALAAYYRRCALAPSTVVVAITGSNGKTTTKRMLDHVLSGVLPGRASPKSFNNHVGVPLTILSSEPSDRYLILEVGTNAPGEIDALSAVAEPNIGVITSIGEAHLEGLGDIEGVTREKASLLRHVRANGLAAVNVSRPEIVPYLRESARRVTLVTVGTEANATLRLADLSGDLSGTTFCLAGQWNVRLAAPGRHHAFNAAMAFAVARFLGLEPALILERLQTFVPSGGRTRVLERHGVRLIDDSYNANPSSMRAAIDTLATHRGGRRMIVMGDMKELGLRSGDLHVAMVQHALNVGLEFVVAVGEAMVAAGECVDPSGRERVICCPTRQEAVDVVLSEAQSGDAVWIKGSRAAELEWVVAALAEQLGAVRAA